MKKKSSATSSSKNASKSSYLTKLGNGGETQQLASSVDVLLTTNHGTVLSDNQNSLKAGPRGPSLLEDFILREKIQHFDHERIPERIVHARGTGAHGYFELTKSLKKYTRSKILNEVGSKTEVFVRFSTVAGGAGSVDTPRDVRGFAVKFYTKEGNWDLVGNNIPVFFIQDALKFPDLIHSVKMEADKGYPQAASAHDTFWDFISLMPESTHMIMWAMSDRAIPRSLRMIEGFGVHTFRLLDDNDNSTLVKFHWRPKLGLQSTCWDEAVKIAGADPDYHRRDLYEAIEAGQFPEWEFCVQTFSQQQADKFPFDVLDPTKLIPEELVPLEVIGRMVLNRNVDNFFAETEQAAFLPTNLPAGIDVSEDPLLQGRLFSYQDTQLSRLGTVNFHQLPINRAKGCPVMNFQRDGQMQMEIPKGRANYEPNSLDQAGEFPGPRASEKYGFRTASVPVENTKVRLRPESFADHYSQARLFFQSQSKTEQGHMVSALVFELSKVTLPYIRERMLANIVNVDPLLAKRVAAGLGMKDVPAASLSAAPVKTMKSSPSLRIIDKYKPTLEGRCVGILLTNGADDKILSALKTELKKKGCAFKLIAQTIGGVTLKNGTHIPVDGQLAGTPSVLFDAIAVVCSEKGCDILMKDSAAVDFAAHAFAHLKALGVTTEALPLLKKANVEMDEAILVLKKDVSEFSKAAATRLWSREAKIRPEF